MKTISLGSPPPDERSSSSVSTSPSSVLHVTVMLPMSTGTSDTSQLMYVGTPTVALRVIRESDCVSPRPCTVGGTFVQRIEMSGVS